MSIIDNAKELATAVHEIKNLELYERVLNLNAGIVDLVEENRQLRAEKDELQKTLKLRENMRFEEPFYYQGDDKTPFCPSCMECKDSAVHVVFESNNSAAIYWHCPACKTQYRVTKDRSEQGPPKVNFRASQWG
jgi:hypothetical protein